MYGPLFTQSPAWAPSRLVLAALLVAMLGAGAEAEVIWADAYELAGGSFTAESGGSYGPIAERYSTNPTPKNSTRAPAAAMNA